MKAIQIQSYGNSDQIRVQNAPIPVPKIDEALIRVCDAGVNPVDWKIREGFRKDSSPAKFPLTLGQDFAGEIIRVGEKVKDFVLGDRVVGFAPQGAYAEYVTVSGDQITYLDDAIDDETAAALPTPGLTAYQIVVEAAKLKPGQTVLIHGASGSVGALALQLAVWKGAKVIANASADDAEYLKEMGATQVLDHEKDRFEQKVSGLDVVIDLVGEETAKRSLEVLKENGILVSTVGAAQKAIEGPNLKKIKAVDLVMRKDADQLAHLLELVKDGTLKIRMAKVLPLDQAKQAQDLSQFGHLKGKIILRIQ